LLTGAVTSPWMRSARAAGLEASGPHSPDTVFLAASRGRYDGVLALYHDQGLIPVKLLAPERGLTLLAGLPFLRVSPAHGTAFDIAGTGRADPGNLLTALFRTADWARARQLRRRASRSG
jgi:4-hydroxythreonine-4-phosphate dehydrogenase